ncbi:hypothetical protein M409DRAFT_68265 [Zasmidium cellare ATCC 36951]|uniref:Peptidase A1 domain-containing protein n=1 Tax=Zasmidium cellare ATCC 36951 TaxID=1080233 RepID=A0A6A6CBQ0_ZASCE|nr:uncharacterized protein M409DRAFT_68265 [Zasmidium cellare ATCC 36951]KAF2163650.1 hypothetical protein M409DRAFT_68265 [Zasmidium cellare ATCC 36951]
MTLEDIKTAYQQKHHLPGTYEKMAAHTHAHVQENKQIKLIKNTKFVRHGTKDPGQLMRKYEITPTLDTPFTIIHDVVEDISRSHKLLSKMHIGTHEPEKHAVMRMQKRDTSGKLGDVPAEDVQNDSEYLASVDIGTPPQTLSLNFDTGSSDLWMYSTKLPKETLKESIQYGDGSTAKGCVGTDTVRIGGLSVEGQAVELAENVSDSFIKSQGDGLCGLAFGTINTVKPSPVHTPVENMMMQGDVAREQQLFTAYLTNRIDGVPPCYTFGYIDDALVAGGTINYAPVDSSRGFWQIKSEKASINTQTLSLPSQTAIMDTGTTLAMIDDTTCKALYDNIPNSKYSPTDGGYIYPSTTPRSALPVLKLWIGENAVTIDPDDIGFADLGNGWVFGGFQSRGNLGFSIFGGSVLKSVYAVFDQGQKRFGFVQKVDL